MTCTRPEAISSFVWCVWLLAWCYYDYFLFIDYTMRSDVMRCVLSLAIAFIRFFLQPLSTTVFVLSVNSIKLAYEVVGNTLDTYHMIYHFNETNVI